MVWFWFSRFRFRFRFHFVLLLIDPGTTTSTLIQTHPGMYGAEFTTESIPLWTPSDKFNLFGWQYHYRYEWTRHHTNPGVFVWASMSLYQGQSIVNELETETETKTRKSKSHHWVLSTHRMATVATRACVVLDWSVTDWCTLYSVWDWVRDWVY